MVKQILLLFFFLLTLGTSTFAQGWVKQFPGDIAFTGENVSQSADGNFVSAMMAPDGLGSGNEPGAYLIKFDDAGNTLFLNKYSDEAHPDGHAVYGSPDGGYFIFRGKVNPVSGNEETYLTKLDADANEVTSTFVVLDNNLDVPQFTNVILSEDDHLFVSRGTTIKKYDLDLNLVEDITLDVFVSHLKMTPEGEFVGIGIMSNFLTGAFKLSNDGQLLWETDMSSVGPSGSFYIHAQADGTYMFFSVRAPSPQGTFLQGKLANDGTILWTKEITSPGPFHQMWNQVPVSDGYISTGQIFNEIVLEKGNLHLVKTDFEGEVVWERQYNVNESEWGYSVVPTSDDGVIGLSKFLAGIGNPEQAYFFRANPLGFLYDQSLSGKIGFDATGTCDTTGMQGLENWYVSATDNITDETYYTTTDLNGHYFLNLPIGIYELTVYPPNALWEVCDNNMMVGLVVDAQISRDFPVTAAVDCPVMAIQSILPVAIPCTDNNTFYVNYCNEGTAIAVDAYVEVTVEDDLSYVSSTIALTSQNGNTYTFDVGDMATGECGFFQVDFSISCDTEAQESVCIESEIYPNADCIPDPMWNGAFVEGAVECEGDSIMFTLTNTGGDIMSSARNFIVIEDALMLFQGGYFLDTQETEIRKFEANGSTLILEAQQEAFAPGDPFVRVWIEGCGTNSNGEFSTGYVNQFSLGDNNPSTDIDCRTASNAYQPNASEGYPSGYGEENYIGQNIDIEYLLRFQNTTDDTAFTVVLLDTIASELDITQMRVGPASHDFEWSIVDERVLRIEFSSLELPSSTTDFDASTGFIEFQIAQQPNLALGTQIKNDAGIYFDFNEVILTNETFHTVGENFIEVSTQNPFVAAAKIEVSPNPFADFTWFKFDGLQLDHGLFELYNLNGKLLIQQQFSGTQFQFHRDKNVMNGNYFYRITDTEKGVINSGQLSIH